VIVVVCVFCIVSHCLTKRISRPAASRLNRIQSICSIKRPKKEIIDATCVICLEDFSNSILEILSEVVNKNDLQEKLNTSKDNSIVQIECGQSFHFGCIADCRRRIAVVLLVGRRLRMEGKQSYQKIWLMFRE
jgi:hypothetical protein